MTPPPVNLGCIVRQDASGLGSQTRAIARMLQPSKVMVINSKPFNGNEQHPEWYEDFNNYPVFGIPTTRDCVKFIQGLTHILTCETPYNPLLYAYAKRQGIKVYNQFNYEFLDSLRDPTWPLPYKFLAPSHWMLEDMQARFPGMVEYLPPPVIFSDFTDTRETNKQRSNRFLHIIGRPAIHDRNGTESLLEALKHTAADFELVIRSQFPIDLATNDPRVRLEVGNPPQSEMYAGFDALLFPRRYAGLCLPMNEALACGLPVIMTDISPNNQILPGAWLVPASKVGEFTARTQIDIHAADVKLLASKIEWLCGLSDSELSEVKQQAFETGFNNYSDMILKERYEAILCESNSIEANSDGIGELHQATARY